MTLELYPCLKKPLSKEKLLFAELLLEELELELELPLAKLLPELLLEELELELELPLTKLLPELLLEELEPEPLLYIKANAILLAELNPEPDSPLAKLLTELLLEKLEPESSEVSLANNSDSNSLAEFNVVALELVDDDALTPCE